MSKAAGFDQLKSAGFNVDRDEHQVATSYTFMIEGNLTIISRSHVSSSIMAIICGNKR